MGFCRWAAEKALDILLPLLLSFAVVKGAEPAGPVVVWFMAIAAASAAVITLAPMAWRKQRTTDERRAAARQSGGGGTAWIQAGSVDGLHIEDSNIEFENEQFIRTRHGAKNIKSVRSSIRKKPRN
jgi:hypothetical protein